MIVGYDTDPVASEILSKLVVSGLSDPNYTLQNGVNKFKGKIWLGSNAVLHHRVFSALHSSPMGGHSGAPATYHIIHQLVFWPSMKKDVYQWVQQCTICQQAKPDRSKYLGLLQPLPVPSLAWELISMDFIEGLPQSGSANSILVVIDKFSKFGHFIPLKHPFTTASVARLFLDNIYRLHGMPQIIVFDRDRIFTSQFWQELFKLAGVDLRLSTAHHPQTDG